MGENFTLFKQIWTFVKNIPALCSLYKWVKKTLIDKYGLAKVIFSILFMLFITGFIYIYIYPENVFEKYHKWEEDKHNKSFQYRMETTPKVNEKLNNIIKESGCMRAFVIEMHNGKYNSAGLSFNYGALTYEALNEGVESVSEDYIDFSLDRFPLAFKVYNEGFWCGTIADIDKIDHRLASRIEANGAKYLAVQMLYGTNENIGFVGMTYSDYIVNEDKMRKILGKYSQQMSPYLDGCKAYK